jgi:predicted small integral membrane protein
MALDVRSMLDKSPAGIGMPIIVARLCKIALVAAIALFFTIIVFGNITDYDSNWQFVQHVLSMDTTFPDSTLRWRAIKDPSVQMAGYWLIIAIQISVAILLWLGCANLLTAIRKGRFARAGTLAVAGLTIGLLLYITGFITIGGEWFSMWQSSTWNDQRKSFEFMAMIGLVLIVLLLPEDI